MAKSAPESSREFFDYEPRSSPEGMALAMPDEAEMSERARAEILGLYRRSGYRLIDPPIVDSLDSLHTEAMPGLRNKSLRLVDPLDARPLILRADITPQIARLDARQMDHSMVQRYAYCGCVVHGQRDHVGARRNPQQIGAELFGHDGLSADLEIIGLALETCQMMGFDDLVLDLGSAEIFGQLFRLSGLHESLRHPLLALMRYKSRQGIDEFLRQYGAKEGPGRKLAEATQIHGGEEAMAKARALLSGDDAIGAALDHLDTLVESLGKRPAATRISYDLIGPSCYGYESGVVFAIYSAKARQELLRGGRYNDIGDNYGRPRSAVGFSGYLHELAALRASPHASLIYAPHAPEDDSLRAAVAQLRDQGEAVVLGLSADDDAHRNGCERYLEKENGAWKLRSGAASR